jgi:PAS domain S-box-containing protein
MAERLRVSVENAEDCAILTCCPDGFITSWNHGADVIFGYGKHEIVGQPYASLIAGDDGGGTLLQAMQAARLEPHVRSERWHQRRDGSRFWAHGRMAPLHDRAGAIAGYIEILHDRSAERQSREALEAMNAELEQRIAERTAELAAANERLVAEMAERERTEVQLRQAQKIEALGHLTGGIAHDFNNLLTAIMGGLEVIRMRTQDPRTLRLIDSSMNAAARGASLITQLRAFAGRQRLNTEVVALNTLVGDMREQLNGIAGHTVVISLALDPGAWPVLADPEQVRVALVNLTANARETMTGGGSLHIATGNESVGPATATPSLAPGDYGTLAVRDDGQGMTEEAMARLFEPFFTTKDVGKGSGLGLAQVYGFVRQSGGDIRVVSHPGQGTSLTLLLPRAVEPAPGPAGHPAPSQDP